MERKKSKIIVNLTLLFIAIVIGALAIISPISTTNSSTVINGVIYKGNENSNFVALTFNVYQGSDEVNQILDILSAKKVKATFFIGGCWADKNTETLNRIVQLGHEIGSHGYFHKDHAKLSYEENIKEIKRTETLIYALCGIKPKLFAPPSGSFSKNTVKACENLGYRVIMWTADTIDWRDADKDLIKTRALKNASSGNIILMHPTKCTAIALNDIIDGFKALSLTPSTVTSVLQGI
ncbi:MAG: polysaccharide deacetylase family protein [Clostridia bacterium]|nr:polysaccharide deacetylase family protein [Clostridia bacterium]